MTTTRKIVGTAALVLALGGCGGAVHNASAVIVHHDPPKVTCSTDLDKSVGSALHRKVNSPSEFYQNLDNVQTPVSCQELSQEQLKQTMIHLPSFVAWETSLVDDMNKALRGTGQPLLTVASMNQEIFAASSNTKHRPARPSPICSAGEVPVGTMGACAPTSTPRGRQ